MFKPTSTVGEYIAAGVTALIPGKGMGMALVRNVIAEGINVGESRIKEKKVNVVDSVMNIVLGTVLDTGFEKVSDKAVSYVNSRVHKITHMLCSFLSTILHMPFEAL